MDIISIQTVAGGTGVTTVATEVIDEWWGENVAILALDFGHNQELGLMLKDRDFELVADAAYMFWSDVDKKPKAREGCAFPRHSLMNLGDDLDTYRNCSEQALLEKTDTVLLKMRNNAFRNTWTGLHRILMCASLISQRHRSI